MRESLKDIQERIPFSSFASTLLAAGDAVPMHLGRNCIGQARALAKELERKGYKPSFINLARANDIHYALLVEESGTLYLLDPSAMHEEPINLTRLFQDRISAVVESRPRIMGVASILTAETQSNSRFSVSRTVYNGKETYTPAVYKFDLDTRSQYLPGDDDSYVAALKRDQLLLRVLNDDGGFTVLKQPIYMGVRKVRKATIKGVEELVFAREDPAFSSAIEEIADKLMLAPEMLIAHMDKAISSYSYLRMEETI
mgnify:FL=1